MIEDIYIKYKEYAKFYNLNNYDTKKLWNIIKPICSHEEFQKRCLPPFWHHDNKTVGEHILCDTIVTYIMIKKLKDNNINTVNLKTACLIAMFHDLYECPWQNQKVKKKLFNRHGFTHPIEAVTNAITWYPKYFKNIGTSYVLIDGILHHMYPLPVRAFDGTDIYLNNKDKFDNLEKKYKDIIKFSTNLGKIGRISLRRSIFPEGRILSKADKKVAFHNDIHSIDGYLALISGNNKKLKKIIVNSLVDK